MPLIVFAHANSFPASTYGVLFEQLRTRGYTVVALEKFGHDPRYPVSDNWPQLVAQLADFARAEVAAFGERAFLVGHSLGGYLSLMCAAQYPELARGVLLLDAPLVGGWRAAGLRLGKRTKLLRRFSPAMVSHQRRNRWPDLAAVYGHFHAKKMFRRWDQQTLYNYVNFGTHDEGGQRALSFDRDVESHIYNTIADNIDEWLRCYPLHCKAGFVGGVHSREMGQVGMSTVSRVVGSRIAMLDGGHLFPMEKPHQTAAAMDAMLRQLDA